MDYSPAELMTVNAARLLRDRDVVFVGVGLPNLACNLARRTHAPNLTMIYEAGVIGAQPARLPLSIGDPTLVTGAASICSMYEIFSLYLQRGLIDVGFLGGAQIDRFGNVNATVILYGDKVTDSMRRAIDETDRRRTAQLAYNVENNITPHTIQKAIRSTLADQFAAHRIAREAISASEDEYDRTALITEMEVDMLEAAEALEFEKAAMLRDRIKLLQAKEAGEEPSSSAKPQGVQLKAKDKARMKRTGRREQA